MQDQKIHPDAGLRDLIRTARKGHARLSHQKAAEAAGISASWWRQIESGFQPEVDPTLLARMCLAIELPPASLRARGYPEAAAAVSQLQQLERLADADNGTAVDDGTVNANPAENHIWQTPGTDVPTRNTLMRCLRAIRSLSQLTASVYPKTSTP